VSRLGAAFAVLAALLGSIGVPAAPASQLIDRGVTQPRLAVDRHGRALVTYHVRGRARSLLAWGAVNARPPSQRVPQVEFQLRYATSGAGSCRRYDGPALTWLVAACTARDGSYWALQSWSRIVPAGSRMTAATRELRLSHWRGELPTLTVGIGWVAGRYHRLVGRLTYAGRPVHGFSSTRSGSPLDGYGRNVYLDTLDSAYGSGWRRENGFLTRAPTGAFCYGFFPHGSRPSGMGVAYRATVIGPGVTPDVSWREQAPARRGATAGALGCPR
jgi:hypothetical protein